MRPLPARELADGSREGTEPLLEHRLGPWVAVQAPGRRRGGRTEEPNGCLTDDVQLRPPATVGGGPAPVRAYLDELLPEVLEGRIDPGRVFDRTVGLDGVPDGYRAMADRESIKVMVTP